MIIYLDDSLMVHIPGFTFPVTDFYLEDVVDLIKYVCLVVFYVFCNFLKIAPGIRFINSLCM